MLSNDSVVAIAITFACLAFVILCARLYARLVIIKNAGPDDYIIMVAYGFALTFSVLIPIQIRVGMGKHADTLTKEQYRDYLKPFWASVVVYTVSLDITKLSILQQYLRFMNGKEIRRLSWIFTGIILMHLIIAGSLSIFACTPVSFFWTKAVNPNGGHCINELASWFANASFNILSDIGILILPMPSLYKIHLPKKQKLGLMLVFAVGFFVCGISIIRLQSLYHVSNSPDITWSNVDAATWSTVESQIAIICASLPALRPFVPLVFKRAGNSSSGITSLHSGRLPRYHNERQGTSSAAWGGHRLESVHIKSDNESGSGELSKDGGIKITTVMAQETETLSETGSQSKIVMDR